MVLKVSKNPKDTIAIEYTSFETQKKEPSGNGCDRGCSKTPLRNWARWAVFAVFCFFSPNFQEPPCRRKNITRNSPPI